MMLPWLSELTFDVKNVADDTLDSLRFWAVITKMYGAKVEKFFRFPNSSAKLSHSVAADEFKSLVFELDEEFQSPEDLRLAARAGAKEDRDQAKSEERLRTDTQDSKGWGKTEWGMTIEQQNQRAILNSGPFQEVQPLTIGDVDLRTIRAAQQHLENGALVTVDLVRQSIRLLPISGLT